MIETIEQYLERRSQLRAVTVSGVGIPCANTLIVRREFVRANTYNPNAVPDAKLELLRQSILDNGFCFPIVTIFDPDLLAFVVIDGFHRFKVSGPGWLEMAYVPVVVLDHDVSRRMAATWQFNKARGHHQVDLDADLIRALIQQGMAEDQICEHLGIDLDTVHRYKQLTGIAELFRDAAYSLSWEMTEG